MLDHGTLNIPGRTSTINSELDKYKARQAAADRAKAKELSAKLKANKAEARELWDRYGEAMLQELGPRIVLKDGDTRDRAMRDMKATLLDWVKWQPARFIRLANEYRDGLI